MYTKNKILELWENCKKAFHSLENDKLDIFLNEMIEIVKSNYTLLKRVADYVFLDYIMKMDYKDFIIGTNGDDYETRVKKYIEKENVSLDEIWRILAQLIWDLSVPVTSEICPSCHCDHLALLVDRAGYNIYKSCETCFGTFENGKQIIRPEELFPANKKLVNEYHINNI